MLSIPGTPPEQAALAVAARARARRLAADLTQAGLAARAGVSVSTLKHFERTGEIAFVTLLRIATALGAEHAVDGLFAPRDVPTIDELLAPSARKRGRRT